MKRLLALATALALLCGALVACAGQPAEENGALFTGEAGEYEFSFDVEEAQGLAGETGFGVSSSSDLATFVGMEVLARGGNAVDAAIAVSYALAVVQPSSSGIGGGGYMLVYDPATGDCLGYNYLAAAPISLEYRLSDIGVPGFVAGMQAVHDDYGTMDLAELIDPAVALAEDGFAIPSYLAQHIVSNEAPLLLDENYLNEEGRLLGEGDTLRQPDLAETLRVLQREGTAAFYSGVLAEEMVLATHLEMEDLAWFEIERQEPVRGEFAGYTVLSAGPSASGLTLVQSLAVLELLDLPSPEEDPAGYLDGLMLARQLSMSQRYRNVGDTRFVERDMEELASPNYLQSLLEAEIQPFEEEFEDSTTHFVVVDGDGMLVSCTNTLTSLYGAKTKVAGFYINNSMDNFTETGINTFEPGKRPRTYITPTIVLDGKGGAMGIGTPGGARIVQMLTTVLWDILAQRLEPQAAVEKNRVLFIDEDTVIVEENQARVDLVDPLESEYLIVWRYDDMYFGAMQILGYNADGSMYGASDTRRQGAVVFVRHQSQGE